MIDLQAIMRHRHISTTQKYYLKHDAAEQAKRLASYLATDVCPEKQVTVEPADQAAATNESSQLLAK